MQPHYLRLLDRPVLIVESLLMNSRTDLLREFLDSFPQYRVDSLILGYARKALSLSASTSSCHSRMNAAPEQQGSKRKEAAQGLDDHRDNRPFAMETRDENKRSENLRDYQQFEGVRKQWTAETGLGGPWCLTGDPGLDDALRASHVYERAPSIELAESLLDLLSDESLENAGLCFQLCDELSLRWQALMPHYCRMRVQCSSSPSKKGNGYEIMHWTTAADENSNSSTVCGGSELDPEEDSWSEASEFPPPEELSGTSCEGEQDHLLRTSVNSPPTEVLDDVSSRGPRNVGLVSKGSRRPVVDGHGGTLMTLQPPRHPGTGGAETDERRTANDRPQPGVNSTRSAAHNLSCSTSTTTEAALASVSIVSLLLRRLLDYLGKKFRAHAKFVSMVTRCRHSLLSFLPKFWQRQSCSSIQTTIGLKALCEKPDQIRDQLIRDDQLDLALELCERCNFAATSIVTEQQREGEQVASLGELKLDQHSPGTIVRYGALQATTAAGEGAADVPGAEQQQLSASAISEAAACGKVLTRSRSPAGGGATLLHAGPREVAQESNSGVANNVTLEKQQVLDKRSLATLADARTQSMLRSRATLSESSFGSRRSSFSTLTAIDYMHVHVSADPVREAKVVTLLLLYEFGKAHQCFQEVFAGGPSYKSAASRHGKMNKDAQGRGIDTRGNKDHRLFTAGSVPLFSTNQKGLFLRKVECAVRFPPLFHLMGLQQALSNFTVNHLQRKLYHSTSPLAPFPLFVFPEVARVAQSRNTTLLRKHRVAQLFGEYLPQHSFFQNTKADQKTRIVSTIIPCGGGPPDPRVRPTLRSEPMQPTDALAFSAVVLSSASAASRRFGLLSNRLPASYEQRPFFAGVGTPPEPGGGPPPRSSSFLVQDRSTFSILTSSSNLYGSYVSSVSECMSPHSEEAAGAGLQMSGTDAVRAISSEDPRFFNAICCLYPAIHRTTLTAWCATSVLLKATLAEEYAQRRQRREQRQQRRQSRLLARRQRAEQMARAEQLRHFEAVGECQLAPRADYVADGAPPSQFLNGALLPEAGVSNGNGASSSSCEKHQGHGQTLQQQHHRPVAGGVIKIKSAVSITSRGNEVGEDCGKERTENRDLVGRREGDLLDFASSAHAQKGNQNSDSLPLALAKVVLQNKEKVCTRSANEREPHCNIKQDAFITSPRTCQGLGHAPAGSDSDVDGFSQAARGIPNGLVQTLETAPRYSEHRSTDALDVVPTRNRGRGGPSVMQNVSLVDATFGGRDQVAEVETQDEQAIDSDYSDSSSETDADEEQNEFYYELGIAPPLCAVPGVKASQTAHLGFAAGNANKSLGRASGVLHAGPAHMPLSVLGSSKGLTLASDSGTVARTNLSASSSPTSAAAFVLHPGSATASQMLGTPASSTSQLSSSRGVAQLEMHNPRELGRAVIATGSALVRDAIDQTATMFISGSAALPHSIPERFFLNDQHGIDAFGAGSLHEPSASRHLTAVQRSATNLFTDDHPQHAIGSNAAAADVAVSINQNPTLVVQEQEEREGRGSSDPLGENFLDTEPSFEYVSLKTPSRRSTITGRTTGTFCRSRPILENNILTPRGGSLLSLSTLQQHHVGGSAHAQTQQHQAAALLGAEHFPFRGDPPHRHPVPPGSNLFRSAAAASATPSAASNALRGDQIFNFSQAPPGSLGSLADQVLFGGNSSSSASAGMTDRSQLSGETLACVEVESLQQQQEQLPLADQILHYSRRGKRKTTSKSTHSYEAQMQRALQEQQLVVSTFARAGMTIDASRLCVGCFPSKFGKVALFSQSSLWPDRDFHHMRGSPAGLPFAVPRLVSLPFLTTAAKERMLPRQGFRFLLLLHESYRLSLLPLLVRENRLVATCYYVVENRISCQLFVEILGQHCLQTNQLSQLLNFFLRSGAGEEHDEAVEDTRNLLNECADYARSQSRKASVQLNKQTRQNMNSSNTTDARSRLPAATLTNSSAVRGARAAGAGTCASASRLSIQSSGGKKAVACSASKSTTGTGARCLAHHAIISGATRTPSSGSLPRNEVALYLDELKEFLRERRALDLLYKYCVFTGDHVNAGLLSVHLFIISQSWDSRLGHLQDAQAQLQQALDLFLLLEQRSLTGEGGGALPHRASTGALHEKKDGMIGGSLFDIKQTASAVLPSAATSKLTNDQLHGGEKHNYPFVHASKGKLSVVGAPRSHHNAAGLHFLSSHRHAAGSHLPVPDDGSPTVRLSQSKNGFKKENHKSVTGPTGISSNPLLQLRTVDLLTGKEVSAQEIERFLRLVQFQTLVCEVIPRDRAHLFDTTLWDGVHQKRQKMSQLALLHLSNATISRRCEVAEKLLISAHFQLAERIMEFLQLPVVEICVRASNELATTEARKARCQVSPLLRFLESAKKCLDHQKWDQQEWDSLVSNMVNIWIHERKQFPDAGADAEKLIRFMKDKRCKLDAFVLLGHLENAFQIARKLGSLEEIVYLKKQAQQHKNYHPDLLKQINAYITYNAR
ncbi:unnamed protein product [Amoebophrya sp. A120]|nr:unnamed protein product [Amoebophrya sp. A120]|eukprot:GSA120T00015424001.1